SGTQPRRAEMLIDPGGLLGRQGSSRWLGVVDRTQLPRDLCTELTMEIHPGRSFQKRVHSRKWRRHDFGSSSLQTIQKIRFRDRWSRSSHSITTAPIGTTTGPNEPESRATPPKRNREMSSNGMIRDAT